MNSLFILVLSAFCSFLQVEKNAENSSGTSGTLTIEIFGFRSDAGQASISLFNQPKAFPKESEKALAIIYSKINNKKSVAVFNGLSAGDYAISVYHDENGNKKMDTNIFGIPKEGVGASNDARGHLGPPKYQDAKFFFDGSIKTISITITYL